MTETAVWRIWNIYPRTNFLDMVWCCQCAARAQCGEVDDSVYSQTSLIRSSFIRIPSHPEEKSWLHIYSIRDASNINGVRLSGSLAYPDIFLENGCVRLSEV